MRRGVGLLRNVSVAIASFAWSGAAAVTCESLTGMALPSGSITSAAAVAAGEFSPGGRGGGNFKTLAAFCRVTATLKPVTDSQIGIEVWIPAAGWNGKFVAVGNGGFAGTIPYAAMGTSLAAGYAAAGTDTGHSGGDASFALRHPEQLIDFAHRGVHQMTVAAKAIVQSYAGNAPEKAYFSGCSTGGRQALTEAQLYPNDYDGIAAGAPANNTARMNIQQIWVGRAVHASEASMIPAAKYAALHKVALEQCDAIDGVKDGVIENPKRCRFDPGVLLCKGAGGDACLTLPQVEAARKIYAGPRGIFPGLEPGSEMGWAGMAGAKPFGYANDVLRYVVFGDAAWDFQSLDFEKQVAVAEQKAAVLTAADPNLKPFFSRGGKLLMYHGWSDPLIAPGNTVNYHASVKAAVGKMADESLRLFMVPGMGHCRGGDGTDDFDALAALDRWVKERRAPDRMEATHKTNGQVDRERPLCAWPQTAAYRGTGSTDDAANFVCKTP